MSVGYAYHIYYYAYPCMHLTLMQQITQRGEIYIRQYLGEEASEIECFSRWFHKKTALLIYINLDWAKGKGGEFATSVRINLNSLTGLE